MTFQIFRQNGFGCLWIIRLKIITLPRSAEIFYIIREFHSENCSSLHSCDFCIPAAFAFLGRWIATICDYYCRDTHWNSLNYENQCSDVSQSEHALRRQRACRSQSAGYKIRVPSDIRVRNIRSSSNYQTRQNPCRGKLC